MGMQQQEARKEAYERKCEELLKHCAICRTRQIPTPDHCEYGCTEQEKMCRGGVYLRLYVNRRILWIYKKIKNML